VDGYSGFLFMTEKGKTIVGFQVAHRFKYAVQKHNSIYKYQLPKITPHICRHTYCSNLIKKQTSVSTVQYLMGHADCGTTLNCYTHIKMEDARNELEKLEVEEEIRKGRARAGIAEARRELGKAANID